MDDNQDLVRIYQDTLPFLSWNDKLAKSLDQPENNLHWGQRKLLLSEIDFLNRYYDSFDKGDKYILYIGASPGQHINYLKKMFPEIKFFLYDRVRTKVTLSDDVIFYKQYFTDEDAEKYKNMNLFLICDIRNLEVRHHRRKDKSSQTTFDEIIYDDMIKQKKWCQIIKPKKAFLKFRVSWDTPQTTYFDGDLYFQIWSGNTSSEMRLVPDIQSEKIWDNKKIEGILFYYNTKTRRKEMKNFVHCISQYYDGLVETDILRNYIVLFEPQIDNIEERICDLSLSITIFLLKYGNYKINGKYLKKIDRSLLYDDDYDSADSDD
jgi:Poly A polymerase regulatory subunit